MIPAARQVIFPVFKFDASSRMVVREDFFGMPVRRFFPAADIPIPAEK